MSSGIRSRIRSVVRTCYVTLPHGLRSDDVCVENRYALRGVELDDTSTGRVNCLIGCRRRFRVSGRIELFDRHRVEKIFQAHQSLGVRSGVYIWDHDIEWYALNIRCLQVEVTMTRSETRTTKCLTKSNRVRSRGGHKVVEVFRIISQRNVGT